MKITSILITLSIWSVVLYAVDYFGFVTVPLKFAIAPAVLGGLLIAHLTVFAVAEQMYLKIARSVRKRFK